MQEWSYNENESQRGKNCYICGRPMKSADVPPVKMKLDRKDRDVHPDCKRSKEIADKELAWMKRSGAIDSTLL